ncbi:MAG: sulfotransferase [Cyanobacteria bacterium J06635_10]
MSEKSVKKPIFIVGMPRSGTTLMSAILSAHPRIAISPESHFLRYWIKRYSNKDFSDPENFDGFWRKFIKNERFAHFGVTPEAVKAHLKTQSDLNLMTIFDSFLAEYSRVMEKPRWGEKTPDHYQYIETLFEWYPNAQVIWMLRDPRAVVSSLAAVPWAKSCTDLHTRVWVRSLSPMEDWAKDSRVKVVQYEKLVTETERMLCEICDFLSETYTPEMINRSQNSQPILNHDQWERTHLQKTLQPIDSSSLDKWKSKLSIQEISIIEHLARSAMLDYGYQPHTQVLNRWRLLRFNVMKARRKFNRYMADKLQPSPVDPLTSYSDI